MAETIAKQIEARLRTARKERDEPARNVIGMLKNKVLMELKSGKDLVEDDALWLRLIAAYAKQVTKSIPELKKAGERSADAVIEAEYELAFCQQFLPSKLDEAATEALVRSVIEANGITGPAMMGKLMGLLMKGHKDELDGQLARQLAQKILSAE